MLKFHKNGILLFVILLLCINLSCANEDPTPPEWIGKAFSEWPQILLTNEAYFDGHTSLFGASSFIIETEKGTLYLATAKHLLGAAGGVEPPLGVNDFNTVIDSWYIYPRTDLDSYISLSKVSVKGLDNPEFDWLILDIPSLENDNLPAYPLKIRKKPITVGEKVYLIGVPYSEPDKSQNLYKGVVNQRYYNDRFRFTISPLVDLTGFSGAPILDEKGFIVGILTTGYVSNTDENLYSEAGGEDIVSILPYLQ